MTSIRPRSVRALLLSIVSLTLFFLGVAAPASAQNRYEWGVYSAINTVQDMVFDSAGDLWLATTGGLVRYSATRDTTTVYRTTEGLLSLNATAVGIDPASGAVYVGTRDGFINVLGADGTWRYAPDVANFPDRPNRQINAFAFYNNRVYVATAFGISVLNPADSTFGDTYLQLATIPQNTPINDILFWNGRLWAATDRGVASVQMSGPSPLDPGSWQKFDTASGLSSERVFDLVVAGGSLVAGTDRGASAFDGTSRFTRRTELPGDIRVSLASMGDHVAAGAGKSLYRFETDRFVRFDLDAANDVQRIAVSGTGMVAAGLGDGNGFGIVQGSAFTTIELNSPVSNLFSDLARMSDGSIWAASGTADNGRGVSRLKEGVWTRFTSQNTPGLGTNNVWNVGPGGENSIWAGMWPGGFTEFRQVDTGLRITNYTHRNSPLRTPNAAGLENYVIGADAAVDEQGRTWLVNFDPTGAAPGAPLLVAKLVAGDVNGDDNGFRGYIPPTNLRNYWKVVIDQNGTKWIAGRPAQASGGALGLMGMNDRNGGIVWRAITSANGLIDNNIASIAVDADGLLWIGTLKGLTVLQNPMSVMGESQAAPNLRNIRALTDVIVNAIEVDALNRKWIGTDQGIIVLSADGTAVVRNFDVGNSPLVDNRVLSLLADNETGDMYIGTSNGLNRVSTDAVRPVQAGVLEISPHPFLLPASEPVRISGLPANARVKILGISGNLVREFDAPGGSVAFWDGRNNENELVASGVYIVVGGGTVGDETVIGKIAVIKQ